MAELLVRAKKHWMDDLKQADINKMSESERMKYDARGRIGDVIVVRPDGWNWGKEECLPTFLVIKLPGVSVDTVKYLENKIIDETDEDNPKLLRLRKHNIPTAWVENKVSLGDSVVEITLSASKQALLESIVEKIV